MVILHAVSTGANGVPVSHARIIHQSIGSARAEGESMVSRVPSYARISIGDKYGNRLETFDRPTGRWL